MINLILLAQLAGPPCGYYLGTEITPEDAPFTGCTLPDFYGRPVVNVRENPLMPGGYSVEPINGGGR
jgi:hypothetical protein